MRQPRYILTFIVKVPVPPPDDDDDAADDASSHLAITSKPRKEMITSLKVGQVYISSQSTVSINRNRNRGMRTFLTHWETTKNFTPRRFQYVSSPLAVWCSTMLAGKKLFIYLASHHQHMPVATRINNEEVYIASSCIINIDVYIASSCIINIDAVYID